MADWEPCLVASLTARSTISTAVTAPASGKRRAHEIRDCNAGVDHAVPGQRRSLVLTTFNSGETGTYRIDLCPNIELCTTPVEPTTWGQVKATYR